MNKAFLIGRLAKDPVLKFTTGSGIAVTTFSIAVDRDYKDADGKVGVDFINIVTWRKLAEICANNLGKGRLVCVVGKISTRSYKDDSNKTVYVTEIVADEVKFLDFPKDGQAHSNSSGGSRESSPSNENDFFPVEDDDIPF